MNTARHNFSYGGVGFANGAYELDGGSIDSGGADFVGVGGILKPSATLGVTVQVGIGTEFLSFGVYCSLDILKVEVPITLANYAQAWIGGQGGRLDDDVSDWDGNPYNRYIEAGSTFRVDLVLSTLNGAFGLYAEIGIPLPKFCWACAKVWKCNICIPYPCGINWEKARYELPLVSWNGLSWRYNMVNLRFNDQKKACW